MRWNEIGSEVCSVARALSVVGDRWTLLILREAFMRTRRFRDFQEHLGAARNIVADRLQKLVDAGVMERRQYQERPPRYEYRLTDKGVDLYPVVLGLANWGDKWLDEGKGRPIENVHRPCGHVMHAVATCSECGEELDPRQVESKLGPALRALSKRDL
jgi:DNA-binding HxlR family transcriptional regulator